MSIHQGNSKSARFDLMYSVDTWIADTLASNHTSIYKKGCIMMKADRDITRTIGIFEKVVQISCNGYYQHSL